jgi:glycine cleavage system transcriptional repressor
VEHQAQKGPGQTYLVISVLGPDRTGIVDKLSKIAADQSCNIMDSRMVVLGGEFAMVMMLTGNWSAIAKVETALPALERELGLTIVTRRAEPRPYPTNLLPYSVHVVALDHTGIVHQIARFFSSQDINIQDMYTDTYYAPHTGTPMFALSMTVQVPAHIHIAGLREQFMLFCEELNLDGVIEPAKG